MDEVAATTSSRPALDFASSTAIPESYQQARRAHGSAHEDHKGRKDHENQIVLGDHCDLRWPSWPLPWARGRDAYVSSPGSGACGRSEDGTAPPRTGIGVPPGCMPSTSVLPGCCASTCSRR